MQFLINLCLTTERNAFDHFTIACGMLDMGRRGQNSIKIEALLPMAYLTDCQIIAVATIKIVIYHQSKRGQEQLFQGMSRGPLRNGAKRSGAGTRDIPRGE